MGIEELPENIVNKISREKIHGGILFAMHRSDWSEAPHEGE